MSKTKPETGPDETPKQMIQRFEKEIVKSGNSPKTVAAIMLARGLLNERFRDIRGTCADVAVERANMSCSFGITLPGGMHFAVRVTPDYDAEVPF